MTKIASLASRKNSNQKSSLKYRQKQRHQIAQAKAILALYGADAASVESSANTSGSAAVDASPNRGSDLATSHCIVKNGVTETEAALAFATVARAKREKELSRLRVYKSRQSKHAAKLKTVCVVDGTTVFPEPEICDAMVVESNKSADLPRCGTRATSRRNDDSTSKLYLRGQLVLPPLNWVDTDVTVLAVLKGLHDYLQKKWKSKELKFIRVLAHSKDQHPEDTGVRYLNGNRYELYVKVDKMSHSGFARALLLSERYRLKNPAIDMDHVRGLIENVVCFATKRAKTLEQLSSGYVFQNFGYIFSHGKVERQDVHIDLADEGHHQMGLLCSPNCPLTTVYTWSGSTVNEGESLSNVWEMPQGLADKLNECQEVQGVLNGFGRLLSTTLSKVNVATQKKGWRPPMGTLLCLPSRVPHCGPQVNATTGIRAVLFFTATPEGGTPYNPDIQLCRTTVVAQILVYVWLKLTHDERKYMLTQWWETGLKLDKEASRTNLVHGPLKVMALALASLKKDEKKRAHMIAALAADKVWDDQPERWKNGSYAYAVPQEDYENRLKWVPV